MSNLPPELSRLLESLAGSGMESEPTSLDDLDSKIAEKGLPNMVILDGTLDAPVYLTEDPREEDVDDALQRERKQIAAVASKDISDILGSDDVDPDELKYVLLSASAAALAAKDRATDAERLRNGPLPLPFALAVQQLAQQWAEIIFEASTRALPKLFESHKSTDPMVLFNASLDVMRDFLKNAQNAFDVSTASVEGCAEVVEQGTEPERLNGYLAFHLGASIDDNDSEMWKNGFRFAAEKAAGNG